jgi:hypothetical protein
MRKHEWQPGQIFTFGSNTGGIHGKGAAEFAVKHCGAIRGQGEGRQGSSYGIPTKLYVKNARGYRLTTLTLGGIMWYVSRFIAYAQEHPDEVFFVTALGTGLAGYRDDQLAPMFASAPANCILPPEWETLLPDRAPASVPAMAEALRQAEQTTLF